MTTPLSPYPDVRPALLALDLPKVLLTTGFRGMQESKIAALDIAVLFDAIDIDALDQGGGPGKKRLLEGILHTFECRGPGVLVIGDSAENEIAVGNALGSVTVQMLRPGIAFSGTAQYHLTTLAELPRLLATL